MSAIPARLAGVGTYVVASPAGPGGELSPALLGAAGLMEVEEFWVMGGAQAIAKSIALVPHGTRLTLREIKDTTARVTIRSGPRNGEEGWCPMEHVRRR